MRLPLRGWERVLFVSVFLVSTAVFAFADPFVDVTGRSGVGDKGRGKGVAWADVDGDGSGADANFRYDIEVVFPSGVKGVRKDVAAGAACRIQEDE